MRIYFQLLNFFGKTRVYLWNLFFILHKHIKIIILLFKKNKRILNKLVIHNCVYERLYSTFSFVNSLFKIFILYNIFLKFIEKIIKKYFFCHFFKILIGR